MHHRFRVGRHEVALGVCIVLLAALVYGEGWIWPLKAAALIIPLSLLFA